MKLSNNLLPYSQKTLILVCDRGGAKFYQALERAFDLINEIKNDRLNVEDIQPYFTLAGPKLSISQDENLKDREAKIFYKKLAQEIFDRKQKTEFQKLIIVIAHEDKNILHDCLHEEIKPLLQLVIPEQSLKISDDALAKLVDDWRNRNF